MNKKGKRERGGKGEGWMERGIGRREVRGRGGWKSETGGEG